MRAWVLWPLYMRNALASFTFPIRCWLLSDNFFASEEACERSSLLTGLTPAPVFPC